AALSRRPPAEEGLRQAIDFDAGLAAVYAEAGEQDGAEAERHFLSHLPTPPAGSGGQPRGGGKPAEGRRRRLFPRPWGSARKPATSAGRRRRRLKMSAWRRSLRQDEVAVVSGRRDGAIKVVMTGRVSLFPGQLLTMLSLRWRPVE